MILALGGLGFGAYLIVRGRYEFRITGYALTVGAFVLGAASAVRSTLALADVHANSLDKMGDVGMWTIIVWYGLTAVYPSSLYKRARRWHGRGIPGPPDERPER